MEGAGDRAVSLKFSRVAEIDEVDAGIALKGYRFAGREFGDRSLGGEHHVLGKVLDRLGHRVGLVGTPSQACASTAAGANPGAPCATPLSLKMAMA